MSLGWAGSSLRWGEAGVSLQRKFLRASEMTSSAYQHGVLRQKIESDHAGLGTTFF